MRRRYRSFFTKFLANSVTGVTVKTLKSPCKHFHVVNRDFTCADMVMLQRPPLTWDSSILVRFATLR